MFARCFPDPESFERPLSAALLVELRFQPFVDAVAASNTSEQPRCDAATDWERASAPTGSAPGSLEHLRAQTPVPGHRGAPRFEPPQPNGDVYRHRSLHAGGTAYMDGGKRSVAQCFGATPRVGMRSPRCHALSDRLRHLRVSEWGWTIRRSPSRLAAGPIAADSAPTNFESVSTSVCRHASVGVGSSLADISTECAKFLRNQPSLFDHYRQRNDHYSGTLIGELGVAVSRILGTCSRPLLLGKVVEAAT